MSDSPFDTVCSALRTTLELREQEAIDTDTRLDLLPNADSLRLLRTITILERTYDIELDDADIHRAQTVGDLTEIITHAVSTLTSQARPVPRI